MKTITTYKVSEALNFDFASIQDNLHTELTDLQKEKIGFTDVVGGAYQITEVPTFVIFKMKQSKRKPVKQDTIEREFTSRMEELSQKGEKFSMDQILSEVETELTRMSDITTKDFLVVYDKVNQLLLVGDDKNKAEDSLKVLSRIVQEDVEFVLFKPESSVMEEKLTGFILDMNSIPDPFEIGENTKLGKRTLFGKKPKSPNVTIKNEYLRSKEIMSLIADGKTAHSLQLDYDGILWFDIDNTFKISAVKFEEHLKYENNPELDELDNFISEYTLKLPEVSAIITTLKGLVETQEE